MATASAEIPLPAVQTPGKSQSRRTRRRCSRPDCSKVDAGGGFCVGHGGGKKCSFPGCTKGYQTGGFCRRHGGGARCQVQGCVKVDAGRGLCRAHGGGKRCQVAECPKADVGGGFCTAHGGGKRCSEPGCTKIDQGGGKCRAHGGARRCRRRNCKQPARGSTGFCTEHGGSRVCSVMSCRRLVRLPDSTGTMCATCAKSQPAECDSRQSNASETEPVQTSSASMLDSFSPMSSPARNARCHGAHIANCLENGCARSFGANCNCVEDCTCNSPTSLSTSREAPVITSTSITTSANMITTPTIVANVTRDFQSLLRSSDSPTPSPRATMIMRIVLQIKSYANALGMKAITALLSSISGVRSVHVVSSGILSGSSPMSSSPADDSSSINENPSSELVVVRGGQSLDLDSSLATLRNLQLAQVNVIEQTSTTWTRKEVVLHIPDMMCPGNCGSSVLNALRVAEGVEAAKLLFERRQVVVRGDMHAEALCTTVADIGFDAQVVSKTLLPRRFRFRVDDLSDVGLHGLKLRSALEAVEGVETIVLLTDRAEVLVVATLLHANSIVKAAEAVGYEMLELSEEAWGIPMEVVPTAFGSDPTDSRVSENDDRQSHQCDMNICPHNGCPRYMTTVAHTAALAVGWAVPGCGMSVGGECTCGDGCKCDGCPEHNPIS